MMLLLLLLLLLIFDIEINSTPDAAIPDSTLLLKLLTAVADSFTLPSIDEIPDAAPDASDCWDSATLMPIPLL
jgi:hypothetical protein